MKRKTPKPRHAKPFNLPCPACRALTNSEISYAMAQHVTPKRCAEHEAEHEETLDSFDTRWTEQDWAREGNS